MSIFKDILNKINGTTPNIVEPNKLKETLSNDIMNKKLEEKFKSEIWAYLKSCGWQETDNETYVKTVYISTNVVVNGCTFEAPYLVEINDKGAFYEEINNEWVYLGESLEITIDDIYSSPTELISTIDELKDIVKDIHNRNFC